MHAVESTFCNTLELFHYLFQAQQFLQTLELRVQPNFTSAEGDTGLNSAPMMKKIATSKYTPSRIRPTSGPARCPVNICVHHKLLGPRLDPHIIEDVVASPSRTDTHSSPAIRLQSLDVPSFSSRYTPQHRDLDDPWATKTNHATALRCLRAAVGGMCDQVSSANNIRKLRVCIVE